MEKVCYTKATQISVNILYNRQCVSLSISIMYPGGQAFSKGGGGGDRLEFKPCHLTIVAPPHEKAETSIHQ